MAKKKSQKKFRKMTPEYRQWLNLRIAEAGALSQARMISSISCGAEAIGKAMGY